jgi:hypothetical protein
MTDVNNDPFRADRCSLLADMLIDHILALKEIDTPHEVIEASLAGLIRSAFRNERERIIEKIKKEKSP